MGPMPSAKSPFDEKKRMLPVWIRRSGALLDWDPIEWKLVGSQKDEKRDSCVYHFLTIMNQLTRTPHLW